MARKGATGLRHALYAEEMRAKEVGASAQLLILLNIEPRAAQRIKAP